MFESRQVIRSENYGNDYFLGCEHCGTGMVIVYKNTKPEFQQ